MKLLSAPAPATDPAAKTLSAVYAYIVAIGRRAAEEAAAADQPHTPQPEREG
jgi:hypothetical protein